MLELDDKALEDAMEFSRGLFWWLEKHWQNNIDGMDRLGYSAEEEEAIKLVTILSPEVKALGLEHYKDIAGNHYLVYPSQSRNCGALMMGSHLDAVPNGGHYDGPSGVVAALATVKILKDADIRPDVDICIPIWRCEEGPAFRRATLGSGLAAGEVTPDILSRTQVHTGRTLEWHMQKLGIDVEKLRDAMSQKKKLIPFDRVAMAFEQHIEQSTTLVKANADVGVVTALRGYVNYPDRIKFTGAPNPRERRRRTPALTLCVRALLLSRLFPPS